MRVILSQGERVLIQTDWKMEELTQRLQNFMLFLGRTIDDLGQEDKKTPDWEKEIYRKVRCKLYIIEPELAPSEITVSNLGGGRRFSDRKKEYLQWNPEERVWEYHSEEISNPSGMMVPFASTPSYNSYKLSKFSPELKFIASHYCLADEQVKQFDISRTSPRDLVRILSGELKAPENNKK